MARSWSCLVSIAVLSFAHSLSAQERLPQRISDDIVEMGVRGRLSSVRGSFADRGDTRDYDDLFDEGTGLSVDIQALFPNRGWNVGIYASLSHDRFDGKEITDEFGVTLEADPWGVTTAVLGAKAVYGFSDGLTVGLHGGLSFAWFEDATLVISSRGSPDVDQELFAAKLAIGFEAGVRLGYTTGPVGFDVGVGYRIQGGPDRGEDATSIVNPGTMQMFSLEAGLVIRF